MNMPLNLADADPRPPLGAWAPGKYICKCYSCDEHFTGDKRAMSCAECAYNDGWRPLSKWALEKHGRHIIGWSPTRFGVSEYCFFDAGGWAVATFNGQIIRQKPERWKAMPKAPHYATDDAQ